MKTIISALCIATCCSLCILPVFAACPTESIAPPPIGAKAGESGSRVKYAWESIRPIIFMARILSTEGGDRESTPHGARFEVVEAFRGDPTILRFLEGGTGTDGLITYKIGAQYLIFTDATGRTGGCLDRETRRFYGYCDEGQEAYVVEKLRELRQRERQ